MQLTSLSLALTRAGFLSFSPASLFAAGEPGVWYEPSLTNGTCFQDSSGTTPVTAVEQPVGLILDKSKGLVLGPELVTNGDFSNGTTGWSSSTIYTSTSSVVDGVFRVNNTTNYGLQLQPISCVVGRAYVITGQARRGTVLSAAIGASANANGSAAIALATTTSDNFVALRCQFVATSTTMYVVLGGSAANSSGYHEYDNISVREIAGNHATQTTSTSRPVLSARYNLLTKTDNLTDNAWTKQTGTSVDAIPVADPDGALTAWFVVGNGGFGIFQAISGTASLGQTTRSVYMRTRSGTATVSFKDPVQTQGGVACNLTTTWQRFTLTETTTPSGGFSAGIWIDDIPATGIEIAQPDLRVANQAHLPYQRVNTATDYDADPSKFKPYLRFDGVDDWLVTPTITPGTDKAQVFAGVRKLSDAATGMLAEFGLSPSSQGSFYLVNEPTSTRYGFAPRGARAGQINDQASVNGFSSPDTAVLTALSDLNNGTPARLKRNTDAFQSSVNTTFGGGNFLAYPLYIGRRGGTTLPFNGHLYGLIVRFGANLPAGTIASTETWLNQRTGAY